MALGDDDIDRARWLAYALSRITGLIRRTIFICCSYESRSLVGDLAATASIEETVTAVIGGTTIIFVFVLDKNDIYTIKSTPDIQVANSNRRVPAVHQLTESRWRRTVRRHLPLIIGALIGTIVIAAHR